MTNLYVDDFKLGLDLRKSILTASPGSLQTLDNCVITPGGEIEKRKSFVKIATLPAGTLGLYGTNDSDANGHKLWSFKAASATGVAQTSTTALPNSARVETWTSNIVLAAGYPVFSQIWDVAEYGLEQFFVTGVVASGTDPTPAFLPANWWLGNNVPQYIGRGPLVNGQKMYRVYSSLLYFSGVGDPGVTNPLDPGGDGPNTVNPGAGFIDLSHLDSDGSALVGMEVYYKQVAIFSRRVCFLYTLDPDPANNAVQQILRIGAVSNASITQFGTGDVLFLSDSGVRSLRALNVSLAAGVTDVGSPIDSLIQPAVDALGAFNAQEIESIIEPLTGRYWLAIANTIYILSYWPSAKINAWSTFTLPYNVDHMTVAGTRVYIRSGDDVYIYGGVDNNTYDPATVVTVRTPHMSADTPTTYKDTVSVNAMVQGNWTISAGMATDNPELYELVATVTTNTYSMQQIPYVGHGTHIGFTLTSQGAGPALLGAINVSFQKAEEL